MNGNRKRGGSFFMLVSTSGGLSPPMHAEKMAVYAHGVACSG